MSDDDKQAKLADKQPKAADKQPKVAELADASTKLALVTREASAPTKTERQERLLTVLNDDPEYAAYLARIPAEKKRRAHHQQAQMRHGLHMVAPSTCLGPNECAWINHCPIPERTPTGLVHGPKSDYPMYQACLYERIFMQTKVVDYFGYLDVDPDNPIEVALVNDLAVIDLLKNRALVILSEGDRRGDGRDLLQVDVTGFNDHGAESTITSLHPAADMLDRLEKRRERIINQLGESRKYRAEMSLKIGGQRDDNKVLEELRAVRAALEAKAPTDTVDLMDTVKLDD